jgi:hypothetical protein
MLDRIGLAGIGGRRGRESPGFSAARALGIRQRLPERPSAVTRTLFAGVRVELLASPGPAGGIHAALGLKHDFGRSGSDSRGPLSLALLGVTPLLIKLLLLPPVAYARKREAPGNGAVGAESREAVEQREYQTRTLTGRSGDRGNRKRVDLHGNT